MITKAQAIALPIGTELHYGECTCAIGPRGGRVDKSLVYRVNGKCKVWKTKPDRFELPIKLGLKYYNYLTNDNAHTFHLATDCHPTMIGLPENPLRRAVELARQKESKANDRT